MLRLVVPLLIVIISVSPQLTMQSAQAFNLNKMLEKIAPPQPAKGDGEDKKPKSGGLFGGGSKPGGLFGGSKSGGLMGSKLPGASSSGGADPYQGDMTLRLACEPFKKTGALYADASESSLTDWSNPVVKDFGQPADRNGRAYITSLLEDEFQDGKGLVWAQKTRFYLGSFSSKKIKKEMETFEKVGEVRLDIAAKIRKAANDEDLEAEERAEAKFAYALILAHYDAHHKKSDLTERYLKSAWNKGSIGAMYVRGRRMYKGESYPKNVNGAKNFVYLAYGRIQEIIEEAEENSEAVPDLWAEPEKLWILFATDPEFEGHKRFQSLAAQAAKIRKGLQKEIDKGAGGGALASKIKRLDKIRASAEMTMARAFGVGQKLAEMNKGLIDLKNRANPNAQVISKRVSMEDDSSQKLAEIIGKQTTKLSPEGMKLASRAQKGAKYVAKEAFGLVFSSSMGAGGLGGIVAVLKSAGHTKNLACRLNTAIADYKGRTKISFKDEAPLKADGSDMGKLLAEE